MMVIMSLRDFVHECGLKNKATSNEKVQNLLSSLSLSDVGIYLGYVRLSLI